MPKVFILNKSTLDYSDAHRFGEVVFLTEGSLPPFDFAYMLEKINQSFVNSKPDDMIVVASLNSFCALASSVFAHKHGCVNFLIFRRDQYQKYSITMKDSHDPDQTSTLSAGDSPE